MRVQDLTGFQLVFYHTLIKTSFIHSFIHSISLTCCACKIMEHVSLRYCAKLVKVSPSAWPNQCSASWLLNKEIYHYQLLESLNDWSLALDSKDGVTIAHIHFAKAFDSVSHAKLYQLQRYGISGNVLACILNFLTDRRHSTIVGNYNCQVSNTLLVGVIQGSCIETILFVYYEYEHSRMHTYIPRVY